MTYTELVKKLVADINSRTMGKPTTADLDVYLDQLHNDLLDELVIDE